MYPRRVAPKAAAKAYRRALVELSSRIPDESLRRSFLLDRAAAYAASDVVADGFAKHPATWLNAGSFDDDPIGWQRGRNGTHEKTHAELVIEQLGRMQS